MPKKSASFKYIVILSALGLLAYLVISSVRQTRLKFDVCMDFKGATHCATATGSTASEAVYSARQIDCQLLTNGRDELMVCMDLSPSRITQLK